MAVVGPEETQRSRVVVDRSAADGAAITSAAHHRQVQPRVRVTGAPRRLRIGMVDKHEMPNLLPAGQPSRGVGVLVSGRDELQSDPDGRRDGPTCDGDVSGARAPAAARAALLAAWARTTR